VLPRPVETTIAGGQTLVDQNNAAYAAADDWNFHASHKRPTLFWL
jgi:hypothetical protein